MTIEIQKHFELKQRDNGESFYSLKDNDKPEWLHDAIYQAHDGMLPDDYIYQWVYDAVCAYDDYDGDIDRVYGDLEGDIYNHALLKWLSSHSDRVALVDETMEELEISSGLMSLIQIAQVREKERVYAVIFEAIKDAQEDDELAA